MANFRNSKPFMTGKFDEADQRVKLHEQIRPEMIARALLREAATNAKMTGNDMIMTLHAKCGLPMWLIDVSKTMSYHLLETWRDYLSDPIYPLTRGVTLEQVECMISIKHYIMDEILTPPTEEETRKDNFKSTIETAIVRKCHRPQKSFNANFTPEKGSHEAPDYDGKDDQYDLQKNLWVIPTEICQWVKKDGVYVPGDTIIKMETLKQLYRKNLQDKKKDAGIPIHLLKQEVKDWIRAWKPTVAEVFRRPDKDRRNEIQTYKSRELRKLRDAVQYAENGNGKLLWRMAFGYLGKLAKIELKDYSLEKRIEAQIRRKYQNKKTRPEGIAYLPPVAAGELLRPMLEERVELLVSKNPKLESKWPWVIKVYFDAEAREDKDGDAPITPGAGIPLLDLENRKERERRIAEMAESEENDE